MNKCPNSVLQNLWGISGRSHSFYILNFLSSENCVLRGLAVLLLLQTLNVDIVFDVALFLEQT